MTATRDVGDISTDPGGKSALEWTTAVRDSLIELWKLNGGILQDVVGTNSLTADAALKTGFTAYSDGLRFGFIAANTSTGACTIDVSGTGSGIGVKNLRDPDGNALAAGAIVAGRFHQIEFVAASDHFRLVSSSGTTNVTVQGGVMLQRSVPARLVTAAGPATGSTSIGSISFQAAYTNSRVIVEGVVCRKTGAGTDDVDGTVIRLFVDAAQVQTFNDHCENDSHTCTPFYFEYAPGDIDSHTYNIQVSSTISATYPAGSNVLWCSEMSPNA